ncbi:MAG: Nudix family hydrolase [Rudaea sp.]
MAANNSIHVAAGILRDERGHILLAQRPSGKHLAGLWEFPGGKCEPGESGATALRRELAEELGIQTGTIEPLIAVPWRYPEKSVLLDVFEVHDWRGEADGREGQALRWVAPAELSSLPMPEADRPVIAALRLPRHYIITPEPDADGAAFLRRLAHVLANNGKCIQLRSKQLSPTALRLLAQAALELAHGADAQLLLNGHADLVQELALDGVHLPATDLMRCRARPLPADRWVAASCHDAHELAHAAMIGVDFVVLGPVLPTASHPQAAPLGWQRFAELVAAAPMPVYALGGVGPADLMAAKRAGAQGVAGISAFWPGS